MWTLLLRLKGPMQSWGTRSRFDDRDTEAEPSKSGVLGLLCAAAGIDRDDWPGLEPLTHLKMGVRVDSAGVLRTDFQTAQLKPMSEKSDTAITRKHFLADAAFVVGLESEDRDLLARLHASLKNPYYPLCLGRKAFLPGEPVYLEHGLVEAPLEQALADLQAAPMLDNNGEPLQLDLVPDKVPVVVDSPYGQGSLRHDVPVAAFSQRRYGPRYVARTTITLKEAVDVSV